MPSTPPQTRPVSSAHLAAHLGGQREKRPPAGGPRLLPQVSSRCPPPYGPEGGHPDCPQRWGGESLEGLDPSLAPEPRPGCQGGRGGEGSPPPASQPPGDVPSASAPCLPPPGGDLPVGTAHFFCLTSEASAGKLSPAVCKHPFPPAKRHQPAAWLAVGSHRLPGLAPGFLPVAGEGCPLLRSGSCGPATGLWPPPVPQPHPWGSLGRPGRMGNPAAGRCRGRNYRTLGRQEV